LYGANAPLPTSEDAVAEPLSPYGASKFAGEAYVGTWARLFNMPNVILRLGNVYGPRQNPHGEAGVVAIFSEQLLSSRTCTLYGDGEPVRDYVYVEDVARAIVMAAENRVGGTFNVATGRGTSVREVFRILREVAGTKDDPKTAPLRPGELERSTLDVSRIGRTLGWRPEVSLEAGLATTFAFYAAAQCPDAG
jgi:UDP-glucose 4-epimerase